MTATTTDSSTTPAPVAVAERRYLTVEEAAEYLRISATSLRRLVVAGVLKVARPTPARRVFDRVELDKYMVASVGA